MGNKNLYKARSTVNDEFYTLYEDIQNEMSNYKEHLKGKIVYCNTDNPKHSNFWKYFVDNFVNLQLRGLLSTCLSEDGDNLLTGYDGMRFFQETVNGNGDFRSKESIEVLKLSDIVVSNPPFSLYREYLHQLIEYDKDFIIVGNFNSVSYSEIFPLIRDNNLWVGSSRRGMDFRLPNGELKNVNASWFTNIPLPKRYETLKLSKCYDPELYPRYDNYDAINVDRVNQIPKDYDGFIGVPITFLDKYNPEQFDIIGLADRHNTSGLRTKVYDKNDDPKYGDLNPNAVLLTDSGYDSKYSRLFIKRKV